MRRLFSTFAHGAPGAGLLIMRLVAGGALVFHGVDALVPGRLAPAYVAFHVGSAAIGVFVIVGLWTPIVGAPATVDAALHAFTNPIEACATPCGVRGPALREPIDMRLLHRRASARPSARGICGSAGVRAWADALRFASSIEVLAHRAVRFDKVFFEGVRYEIDARFGD